MSGVSANGDRIAIRRIIHSIHATAGIAACLAKYMDIPGAIIFAEGYFAVEDRDMACDVRNLVLTCHRCMNRPLQWEIQL
jgi:hypothetical protein